MADSCHGHFLATLEKAPYNRNVKHPSSQARVAEQADAADSKSAGGDTIGVRFSSRAPSHHAILSLSFLH